MSAEKKICPYPGLRPFNEEESIFFKGRDKHIEQIVNQLQERKFLMLTGASGEGKSSLVYAGVIPHARAGFFKARFNNWVVADFRPERSPLKNLAGAVCDALAITDPVKAEKELSYGFSALVDLYKSSRYYLDLNSPDFNLLADADKRKTRKKAANLLILVDQFEEFFTNQENYAHGKPSFEAQAVMNVVLETARIALESDIPIYIICTMRSDYIGHCAAFRNLPEYIGFSQFFVPRLNRKEIYQVIEEPALLNGDKITKRLVETLISQLDEGQDQLPVLQHALNQVWQMADNGNVEMDLVHMAKIGGLNKKYLNPADRQHFEEWLQLLPDYKKAFFKNPSLDNVLDTHANELLEIVARDENFRNATGDGVKKIIEVSFRCLTKIDESRAVRNRMTLEEIVHIINDPKINTEIVGDILNIYRKQGNTFLKPFITDEPETEQLTPKSILDITHESLIRNWTLLNKWAKEEYEDLLNFEDFSKQLHRWVNSKKSPGYLLPIGPLTFFERWFNQTKPNKYWLAKYNKRDIPLEQKLAEADEMLQNASDFLRQSARRLFITRTVLKYGANRLFAAIGILLLLISCAYFTFDFIGKQNDSVIRIIENKSKDLLSSKYIKSYIKSDYILNEERLHPGSFVSLIDRTGIDSIKADILRNMMATCIANQEEKAAQEPDNPLLGPLFLYQLHLMNKGNVFYADSNLVKNINNIVAIVYEHILMKRDRYPVKKEREDGYQLFCTSVYNSTITLLHDTDLLAKIDINQFNKLLQTIPDLVNFDKDKIKRIVDLISPYNVATRRTFDLLYPAVKVVNQTNNLTISHNGGFFEVANLYGLIGDMVSLNQSYDSILAYNRNFLDGTGNLSGDGYLVQYLLYDLIISDALASDAGQLFVQKVESHLGNKIHFPLLFLLTDRLVGGQNKYINRWLINENYGPYYYMTQKDHISSAKVIELLNFNINQNQLDLKLSADEKNFVAALLYKAKAFENDLKNADSEAKEIRPYLFLAFDFYSRISPEYKNQSILIGEDWDNKSMRRCDVFKYPIYIPVACRSFNVYSTELFENYQDPGIFISNSYMLAGNTFYAYDDEENLNKFLLNYASHILKSIDKGEVCKPDLHPYMDALDMNEEKIDKDAIRAFLSIYYYRSGDFKKSESYFDEINLSRLFTKEKFSGDNGADIYGGLACRLAAFCSLHNIGKHPNSHQSDSGVNNGSPMMNLVDVLPTNDLKRNALLVAGDSLQNAGNYLEAIAYTDTLLNTYIVREPKFGNKLFQLLGRYNASATNKIAMNLIKDKNDQVKPDCLKLFIKGLAESSNYFTAFTHIPDYVSSANQLMLYTTILNNKIKSSNSGWSYTDNDYVLSSYESSTVLLFTTD